MVCPTGKFDNRSMVKQADKTSLVEVAISEVLGAERDALVKIAACEDDSQQIVQQARKEARELVRNTQRRISRLHRDCAARTVELLAEMESGAAEGLPRPPPENIDEERLCWAVERVAAELTVSDKVDVR